MRPMSARRTGAVAASAACCLAAVLGLCGCAGAGANTPKASREGPCGSAAARVRLERRGAQFVATPLSGEGAKLLEGRPRGKPDWRGDLNGDGKVDLILDFGLCGNWGECVKSVLARCGDSSSYAVMIAPDYFFHLRVGQRRTRGWLELIETQRGGAAGQDDLHQISWVFGATGYRRRPETRRAIQKVRP